MPVVDPNDSMSLRRYGDFVENSPYGHMMQAPQWSHVKNNWNADFVYLTDDGGEITAALSILSISNDGESSFIYAPRGPVCNMDDTDTVVRLLAEAHSVVQKRNGFLLRLDPYVPYSPELAQRLAAISAPDAHTVVRSRGLPEHSFSNPRHNMVLEFQGRSFEEIVMNMKSKRRNQLRKTYKNGVTTERLTVKDSQFEAGLDTFYELTKIMAHRQGITYRPRDYFERLFQAFPMASLYQAGRENETLCSSIMVCYNKLAFYIYAASSDEDRYLNAPVQLCMEQVKDAIALGMTSYDMGGVYGFDENDGLFSFKTKVTGEDGLREFVGEIDFVFNQELYQEFIKP